MGIRDYWKNRPDLTTPFEASVLNGWGALVDDRVLDAEAARDAAQTSAEAAAAPGDDAVAAYVATPGTATRTQLDATTAPPSLTGTYAARPAATAVRAGAIYYCTNIPEQYRSNGATWSVVGSGGNELGYAEILTVVSPSGTTPVDVAGLTVTFVAGERPVEVVFSAMVRVRDAGSLLWAYIVLDGTSKAAAGTSLTFYQPTARTIRLPALTPGTTHTVKMQAAMPIAAGTGIGDIFGAADNPVSLSVRTR